MGEYFDLAFFLDKEKAEIELAKRQLLKILDIPEGKSVISKHKYSLFENKEVLTLFYDFEGNNYAQYHVCLSDLVFTKKNIDTKLTQLLQVVDDCLSNVESTLFATGIYELTFHYIEGINYIKDFNQKVFKKFPLVFLKQGKNYGLTPKQRYKNISYILNLNKNVQNIFANPISELMEDYGMSFEEAKEKAKW